MKNESVNNGAAVVRPDSVDSARRRIRGEAGPRGMIGIGDPQVAGVALGLALIRYDPLSIRRDLDIVPCVQRGATAERIKCFTGAIAPTQLLENAWLLVINEGPVLRD